jgi:hypothetical protein
VGLKLNNQAAAPTPASGKVELWTELTTAPTKRLKSINDAGTIVSFLGTDGAISQTNPANAATTSTAGLMQGLAVLFTPVVSSRVLIMLSGDLTNNTASDGVKIRLRYGTGSAPADEAALTGTTLGNIPQFVPPATANLKAPFAIQGIASGLTVGTQIWVDIELAAITGGTATAENLSLSIHEI